MEMQVSTVKVKVRMNLHKMMTRIQAKMKMWLKMNTLKTNPMKKEKVKVMRKVIMILKMRSTQSPSDQY